MAAPAPAIPRADLQLDADQRAGKVRNGEVSLRDFDEGVFLTLQAEIDPALQRYFVTIPGIDPAPGWPGASVVFANPEDTFQEYRLPTIVVVREDISPATDRWHPGAGKYRQPGNGALPMQVSLGGQVLSGFDRVEEQVQSQPYDITYTLKILARHRGAPGNKNQANAMLKYVMKRFPPYGALYVRDDLGPLLRTYECFQEGVANLDEVVEVTERLLGFAVSIRVEAELDLNDVTETKTVTKPLTMRMKRL